MTETVQRLVAAPLPEGLLAGALEEVMAAGGARVDREIDDAFSSAMDDALAGAHSIVTCADRVTANYPVDVVIGAHHLVVVRDPSVRLVFTGQDAPAGSQTIERFVIDTHLDTVWRTGELSTGQRDLVIRCSAMLLALGDAPSTWCAVRAAFELGTPVIARDVGALRLLSADAALILPADCGPRLLAGAIDRVRADGALQSELVERGRARMRETRALDAVPATLRAVQHALAVARAP